MKTFKYHSFLKLKQVFMQLLGMLAILIFNSVAILLIYGVRKAVSLEPGVGFMDNPRIPFYGLALGFIFISWVAGGAFSTFLPTISVDDNGIQLSAFLILKVRIPWSSIIDVTQVHIGMGTIRTKYTVVMAKKITLFHYLTGWMYTRTFKPAFLIHEDIDNYKYLVETIRRNKSYGSKTNLV